MVVVGGVVVLVLVLVVRLEEDELEEDEELEELEELEEDEPEAVDVEDALVVVVVSLRFESHAERNMEIASKRDTIDTNFFIYTSTLLISRDQSGKLS